LAPAVVYNASVAGSTIAYQQARITAMYPEQPDLVVIHHGHNYNDTVDGPAFVPVIDAFLSALFAVW
jgi:hypothetical protein